jgi:hypothetical protein
MPAKDAEHRREYMRWYMAQRRKLASQPAVRAPVGADFIGPPCPPNLPDRPIEGRQYAGQVELLKAHLAHVLSLWRKSSEDLLLQVEMLTVESETLQAQNDALQTQNPASSQVPTPQTLPPLPQNLPSPLPPPENLADEVDQYLRDKSQGLVDPNRLPKGADDAIDF